MYLILRRPMQYRLFQRLDTCCVITLLELSEPEV